MKRNLYLMFSLALAISLVFISAASAQVGGEEETLYRVEIRNRTDQAVSLSLTGMDGSAIYLLTAAAGANPVFTLKAGAYDQTTFACGDSAEGTLEVRQQLRLVFTSCYSNAPNPGAPAIEKIHLTDSPDGKVWYYQYNPTPQPSPTVMNGGAATGPCQLKAREEVTIYNRPSTAAGVFSTQGAGFSIHIDAQTEDGWLGFDPGVAQAANIGPFRLRWIEPGTGILSGTCSSLPVVWGPPPGICFNMPMDTVNVHANPDASSPVTALLHLGEFAEILGLAPGGNWARVDLGPGNTGSAAVGWVEASTLNVSGPCDSLPTINP